MMRRQNIHYATNVFHYDQALAAMRNRFEHITLQRRYEPDERSLALLRRIPGSEFIQSRFARRVRDTPRVDQLVGLGITQLAIPLLGLAGLSAPGPVVRAVNHQSARRVAARMGEVDVFQFVEGLGHVALSSRDRRFGVSLMERRNLHHEVFEESIDVFEGFPHRPKLDPLRDYLLEEYDKADRIITYSNVAAQSFTERGFDASKIDVVPLAVHGNFTSRSVTEVTSEELDPFSFLYVGRADAFKGLDLAVAAIHSLGAPFRLKVAGPASKEAVAWMTGFDQVQYLGVVSRETLHDLYIHSAALIAPSVESFGLAIIDAAAVGLHVVCRETTGAAQFLEASQTTIVHGRGVQDWSATIEAIALAPQVHRLPSSNGAAGLADGSMSQSAFEEIYAALN